MKPILIIAAMPLETVLLEGALTNSTRLKSAGFEYLTGKLGEIEIIVCAGGVGKINSATATAALIELHNPLLVINTGCAGAYIGSGLSIGDLAVASEEVLGDEGVILTTGWKDLSYMELPMLDHGGLQYFNTIPLSSQLSEKAMQLADSLGRFLTRGRFATVSTCSGTEQRGEELVRRWNVIAENMEGAAVAQVCLRYGVDCLEIRGISNMVEERDMKRWELTVAVEAAQRFVLKYIDEINIST
jgi:futalosine hydrolase